MTDKEKLAYIAGRLQGLTSDWIRVQASLATELNNLATFALKDSTVKDSK